ncbi:MAG: hypothetical protein B7Z55_06905 [Planctomycetales bacterium 12-60-4]|nr:MAG: hypothetical protein B7Z55_06905 [Planctomycetales bacterium 12-60-4]
MSPNDEQDPSPQMSVVYCEPCGQSYALQQPATLCCPTCGRSPNSNLATITAIPDTSDDLRASAAQEVDALIGNHLGVYRLETLVGAGAMGRVYLATHRDLQRSCALKILPPRLADSDPNYVTRFLNEGRAAASLVHPNIITVHAIGAEQGFNFLEMEFVAGQTLRDLIEEDGPQTPERATALTARIAEGLAAAHTEGLLHRDLKLDNVGLAKRVLVDPLAPGNREIVGTPPYMAPELFDGAHATASSDVYALGVCYYVLLTGKYPFYHQDVVKLSQLVRENHIPNPRDFCPQLPLEMAECLYQMLSKAPSNRPRDAYAASQHLLAVLGQTEDLGSLLSEAFRGHQGITWSRTGDNYRVELEFSSGRHQTVFVEPSQHAAADRLLTITSICARADAAYYERALRLNSDFQHGALALREIQGQSYFVMLDSYPRSTVDAEEIRRSVLEVAHHADAVELLITDRDVH